MLNYKKIFKTPGTRKVVLDFFRFIPDRIMLPIQYRIKLGRKLDLKTPKRFTEKIQWYKMYYRNPIMHQCVDKFLVRNYVKNKGLDSILVPLIGHYTSFEEISWDELPREFVMKATHGGGGLNVLVCNDKSDIDFHNYAQKFQFKNKPVAKNTLGREWAYYGLMPGIIVEKLIVNDENPEAGVNDYKFFCYDGKPKFIVVDVDRYVGHKRNFYNINWENLNIGSDCPSSDQKVKKPKNFDEMLEIASKLSKDFPFVRVDLYNCAGKIYFGELTFYPWSGYVQYSPDEADFLLGADFKLKRY